MGALTRECLEEIGRPIDGKVYPIECYTTPDGRFQYHTFFAVIEGEFIPTLNHEHVGWAWCDRGSWPRPLHGGLQQTLSQDTVRQKIDIILESSGV